MPKAKTKRCNKCLLVLDMSQFSKSSHNSDGKMGHCKACMKKAKDDYRARKAHTPEYRWKVFEDKIRRRFKLTPEQYQGMLDEQGGGCAICGHPESVADWRTGEIRRLSVDHDHSCCPGDYTCGRCIRGLLCQRCNSALGMLGDKRERVEAILEYLDRFHAK